MAGVSYLALFNPSILKAKAKLPGRCSGMVMTSPFLSCFHSRRPEWPSKLTPVTFPFSAADDEEASDWIVRLFSGHAKMIAYSAFPLVVKRKSWPVNAALLVSLKRPSTTCLKHPFSS